MKTRFARTMPIAVIALAFTSGCSQMIVGQWMAEGTPSEPGFHIISATFKDDGTYSASARMGANPDPVPMNGTFIFDGLQLKLKKAGESERIYGATLWMHGVLEISKDGKKQALKKQ